MSAYLIASISVVGLMAYIFIGGVTRTLLYEKSYMDDVESDVCSMVWPLIPIVYAFMMVLRLPLAVLRLGRRVGNRIVNYVDRDKISGDSMS